MTRIWIAAIAALLLCTPESGRAQTRDNTVDLTCFISVHYLLRPGSSLADLARFEKVDGGDLIKLSSIHDVLEDKAGRQGLFVMNLIVRNGEGRNFAKSFHITLDGTRIAEEPHNQPPLYLASSSHFVVLDGSSRSWASKQAHVVEVTASVDDSNTVRETNERNNACSLSFVVTS